MKRIALVLLFISCVAANGIALSSGATPPRQQNSETSASSSSARPNGSEQSPRANESKGQKEATAASDNGGRSRRVARKLKLPTPARSKSASHPKHVANDVQHDRERSRSENFNSVHPPKPAGGTVRTVNTHNPPIRPTIGSAIDGRQFRLGRNTAAAPVLGGSANARKNTQALNGTGTARRH